MCFVIGMGAFSPLTTELALMTNFSTSWLGLSRVHRRMNQAIKTQGQVSTGRPGDIVYEGVSCCGFFFGGRPASPRPISHERWKTFGTRTLSSALFPPRLCLTPLIINIRHRDCLPRTWIHAPLAAFPRSTSRADDTTREIGSAFWNAGAPARRA